MRWRELKQGKRPKTTSTPEETTLKAAPIVMRFKAWVIDMFMIYVPILYITTYFILDGKEAFQSNHWAIFVDTILFGLILALFWTKKGQSPGLKAYDLHLIDSTTQKSPSFLRAFGRYIAYLVAGVTIIGLLFAPFRKDRKNLHDILSRTLVIS